MFYKMKNIVGISALTMLLATSSNLYAQGVVTLSEDAMFEEETPDIIPVETPAASNAKTNALNSVATGQEALATEPSFVPAISTEQVTTQNSQISYLGNNVDEATDDEVFSKMSNLEKQTALLNLELRRERVKNEIEAVKNQRKQAVIQEKEKAEEKKRKQIEWEKTQEQKVLQEQQGLRELDIQFEKIRQEKLLNSYKNDMLAAHQEWIAHEGDLYKQINDLRQQNQLIYDDAKNKISNVKANITAIKAQIPAMILAYEKEIENKQTQIALLKSRIEAQERELAKRNPFAEEEGIVKDAATENQEEVVVEPELKLANMYAVMEIRGQNGELIAKLINQDGIPFYVKKGTVLQSGHEIGEITSTFVQAQKNGLSDFLYFAAGGILPKEQAKTQIAPKLPDEQPVEKTAPVSGYATSQGVPGLGTSMIAR